MCEILPPAWSPFSSFIDCWCQATSTSLQPSEQYKRAYYWSWQSHNWFDTVLYLQDTHPLVKQWWLLDPTPQSANEAGVNRAVWDSKLDPHVQPWLLFKNVCSQFSAVYKEPNELKKDETPEDLTLWDILEIAQIQEASEEMDMDYPDCPVCVEPVPDAAVYNRLLEDYTTFQNEQKLQLNDFRQYQLARGATVNEKDEVTIDPIDPITAAFIRKYLGGQSHNRQLIITFLSNPFRFTETGPIVHGSCKHAYHDECIWLWGNNPHQGGPRVRIPYVFAPLKFEQGKQLAVETKILKDTPQFGCPMCRKEIKNVYLEPHKKLLPLALNYNFNPSNVRAEGPYALRANSLVWVYRRGRFFGGDYAGEPGILIRYLEQYPNNDNQQTYRMDCDVSGGCLEVQMLMNGGQLEVFPVAAVFDISFLETGVLPTRAQVSQLFDRPLISSIRVLEQGRVENIPTYITEGIGFGDYIANPDHTAAFNPGHKLELDNRLEQLTRYFTNNRSFAEFAEHLQNYRANQQESPLRGAERGEPLSVKDMWKLIMKNSGYFVHEPAIIVEPASRPRFISRQLIDAINANPVLHNITISLHTLNVMLHYAIAGYNLIPNLSPVIIPVLKQTFPELPDVADLRRLPLDRPIVFLPAVNVEVRREVIEIESPEPRKKKRKVGANTISALHERGNEEREEEVIIVE